MANLQEILAQLTKVPATVAPGTYGQEVAQTNAFAQAPLLSDAIVRYQKEQRSKPLATELTNLSKQFGTTGKTQQGNLNAKANALRNAYIQSGGSPNDLPQNLWGGNPAQGFQTGSAQFASGASGDNLSIGQKTNLSNITGMYENKPTWNRQVQTADLTGKFNGQDTISKILADKNYNLAAADSALNKEKFAFDKLFNTTKLLSDQQTKSTQQIKEVRDNANKYFDGIKVMDKAKGTEVELNPITKADAKDMFNFTFDEIMSGKKQWNDTTKQNIMKEMPNGGGYVINALESAMASSPK